MIHKATLQDIPAIRSLAEKAFPSTYSKILRPDQIDYMMDMMYSVESLRRQMTEEANVFLIEDGRGYVSYRPDCDDVYHLEKLYVIPEFQKTGLGRKLFEAAASEVRALGGKKIELNVNRYNPALSFYRHIGMEIAREGDFPIGNGYFMNDYIMSINI